MKWLFVALVAAHGLIHFMGPAKAFGLADLPQLTQPISRAAGVVWLAAALTMIAAAVAFAWSPRFWWIIGAVALILSQALIFSTWTDAKFGTIPNVLLLGAVVYAFASQGPLSFRAEYRRAVVDRLGAPATTELVTEADLGNLPDAVARYLRVTGSIGQPRPRHFRATWQGRIRGTETDPWMNFTAVQHNFVGEPARFFHMDARRGGLPVDVLHAYAPGGASMRVRLLSVLPLVEARGSELLRAETVTVFNDLCLLAPGALIDPAIRWETLDARTVRAHYTVGPNTISAVLVFDEAGELVDFVSDDRLAASADGKTFTRRRWSTPVSEYRTFGQARVITRGEGRWHTSGGDFVYIELELLDLEINHETWK